MLVIKGLGVLLSHLISLNVREATVFKSIEGQIFLSSFFLPLAQRCNRTWRKKAPPRWHTFVSPVHQRQNTFSTFQSIAFARKLK